MLAVAYATTRASHVRQVKGDDPDKKGYPGPPSWGLGVRLTTSTRKKHIVKKPQGHEAGRMTLRQRYEAVHNGLRLRKRNELELNIGTWKVN